MAWICPKCKRRNAGAPRRCLCGTTVRVGSSNSRPIRDDGDGLIDDLIDVVIVAASCGAFDDDSSSSSSSSGSCTSSSYGYGYGSGSSSYGSSSSYDSNSSSSSSSSSDSDGSWD